MSNDHNPKRSTGHLEVICGGMFSGKSEELIRRVRRAEIAKQHVQVFSHALDTRHGLGRVASHNGSNLEAIPVKRAARILEEVDQQTTVVAIDETQFFEREILAVVNELVSRGIRVIVAGLDLDFRAEPFGPMHLLMAQAERLDKLSAICVTCGEPASRTQRLIDGHPANYNDPIILVGASEVYEARCRRHHEVPSQPN